MKRPTLRTRKLFVALCLGLAACDGDSAGIPVDTPTGPGAPAAGNPLAGAHFYVEPTNHALTTAAAWRTTRPADAQLLERIGLRAQAVWFNEWQPDVRSAAASYVSAAAAAGAIPVLVVYNIPKRDCVSTGSSTSATYLSWVGQVASGIGSRRAVVVLEPDALGNLSCLSAADGERRLQTMAEAVGILTANAATLVYLDAGHARWIGVAEMARRLKAANVAAADGFALNAANFVSNSESVTYGAALSSAVGGKHFVIDTSRNGQGPAPNNEWCNPAGRGLGVAPTTTTGHSLVDALVWIKRPGESDGTCNGGPAGGKWWPEYALGLAERATSLRALN